MLSAKQTQGMEMVMVMVNRKRPFLSFLPIPNSRAKPIGKIQIALLEAELLLSTREKCELLKKKKSRGVVRLEKSGPG